MKQSLLLLIILTSTISFAQSDWKLSKDKKGIKVYTRTPEGSKIKQFRAEATVNASIPALLALLDDIPTRKEWMYKLELTKEVGEAPTTAERYIYTEINMPWPFNNRDLEMHEEIVRHAEEVHVIMTRHEGIVSTKKGIIRMPAVEGGWYFTEINDKQTHIRYEFLGDPGGSIPAWIVNMFIVDGPYDTITKLKERLEGE